MKKYMALLGLVALLGGKGYSQEPWNAGQLMAPEKLVAEMKGSRPPLVICIGTAAIIPHSVNIGMAYYQQNVNKLRAYLKNIPKNKEIVIYCGCCPFEHCPNIRPAFEVLNEMGFKNHKLLHLPHNIRTDWINKGYPIHQL